MLPAAFCVWSLSLKNQTIRGGGGEVVVALVDQCFSYGSQTKISSVLPDTPS